MYNCLLIYQQAVVVYIGAQMLLYFICCMFYCYNSLLVNNVLIT